MPPNNITDTLTERGARYGAFKDHAEISQSLKATIKSYMGEKWNEIEDDQRESIEMICHKIARIANGDPNYADSWIDIAGYATLVADRLEGVVR